MCLYVRWWRFQSEWWVAVSLMWKRCLSVCRVSQHAEKSGITNGAHGLVEWISDASASLAGCWVTMAIVSQKTSASSVSNWTGRSLTRNSGEQKIFTIKTSLSLLFFLSQAVKWGNEWNDVTFQWSTCLTSTSTPVVVALQKIIKVIIKRTSESIICAVSPKKTI